MSPVPRRLILLLAPFLGTRALAQPPAAGQGRELKRRQVSLPVSSAAPPVELHVAPGFLTTLEFDSPVDRETVTLHGDEKRFARLEVNSHTLVLRPALELAPGERVLLTVPFMDGRAPARGVFALVAHASEVDVQVQVSRLPRTAEAVQAELDDVRAACAAKDAELEELRARTAASGPAGMIFAGLLDATGVQAQRLPNVEDRGRGMLTAEDILIFQANRWAAVALRVRNAGTEPWAPAEARLSRVADGVPLPVLAVRTQVSRIEPGRAALVVVESGAPGWPGGQPLRLELRGGASSPSLLILRFVF
ncbi:DUF2381 family protein [Pyxidicoccus parkwayensis]|uniref:DUF2381 family protein n=1 Tax=Pyxidicoccus parkwayensis TaxID=2813578 RepID=A0ABX7NS43_9BACT|nr:DUF2381 family protein [Pyxidicoccus parkwaysis]QSQ21174.1 DUF2381 family protein [Pyxidicoccus parkwaysis]